MSLIKDMLNSMHNYVAFYEQEKKSYTAIMYMLVSGVFFILSGTFIKQTHGLSSMQIFCLRSVVSFILNSVVLTIKGNEKIYIQDKEAFHLVLKRIFFGFIADFFFVSMLSYLTMGDCTALLMTYPIVSTIMAAILLHEHISKYVIISLILCLIGIVFVCKPPFILHYFFDSFSQSQSPDIFLGFLNALGFTLFLSFSIITTRRLSGKVSIQVLLNYLYFQTILLSTVFIIYNGDNIISYATPRNMLMLMGTGFSQYCANVLYNKSLFLEKASIVVPFSYTQVIFSFMSDVFIFGYGVNIYSVFGCILIVSGSYITMTKN